MKTKLRIVCLSPQGQYSSQVEWQALETVTDWQLWAQAIHMCDSTARQVVTEARQCTFWVWSWEAKPTEILPICIREGLQIWAQPAQNIA